MHGGRREWTLIKFWVHSGSEKNPTRPLTTSTHVQEQQSDDKSLRGGALDCVLLENFSNSREIR
jgi:hypothetical protein